MGKKLEVGLVVCKTCQHPLTEPFFRFCPHCGRTLVVERRPHGLWVWGWPLAPLLALVGSFAPWVSVRGMGPAGQWNVYHFGPASWLWLVGDIAALGVAVGLARGARMRVPWVIAGWTAFGSLSCGVALSGLVFVKVAGTVSTMLGAPNPIRIAYGTFIFAAATVGWLILAFRGWVRPFVELSTRHWATVSKNGAAE